MITIVFDAGVGGQSYVDRDGSADIARDFREGFDIWIGAEVRLHFDDEQDAVRIAEQIFLRLGYA